MKILAFSDVHANRRYLKNLVKKAKHADILICAGDLSLFEQGLTAAAKLLSTAKKPILIIPGNHETERSVANLQQHFATIIPLHNTTYTLGDTIFYGYGLGGFSFHDNGMERFIKRVHTKISHSNKKVFITHAPPYNTPLDYLEWAGEHRGCKTTVDMIKQTKPHLAFCGHFHETAGQECRIGTTKVINAGWEGKIISL